MAYPSVYPTSLDSYSVRTDNVDNVMAVDVNELQSAIVAIETKLGTGQFHKATGDGVTWGFKAGAALDVLWYRGGDNLWQTPNSLAVDVGLNVGTASGATAGQVRASAGCYSSGVTSQSYAQQSIASLADHGKEALGLIAGERALVFISASTGTFAIYTLQGGIHTTQEISDPDSKYTVTEDNDTTTNIYWDAGNARYELNNELGSAITYSIWILRVG